MDFLLQFRLVGQFKPYKHVKSPGSDEGLHHKVTNYFVLLSRKASWNFLQYCAILIRFLITTYISAFEPGINFSNPSLVNYLCDLFYLVDLLSAILLWIHWHRNQGDLTERSNALSRLLWRSREYKPRHLIFLVVDGLSLAPLEFITFFLPMPIMVSQSLHLFPIMRIYRIVFIFAETGLEFSLFTNVVKILWKFFALAIVISHSMSCLLYMMQDGKSTSISLATENIKYDEDSAWECYLVCLYYVLTTFTNVGFGDILPRTDYERIFSLILAMMGFALINGYLIGALSSVLLEQARRLTNLRLRLKLIEAELEERKVPTNINRKIMRFYYALWVTRKGAGSTNPMLEELPSAMSSEVYYDIFLTALSTTLLFRSCDEYSQRAICRVMEIKLYMAGDVILKRSEMNSKMFFIRKGTIQIMSYQDDETEIMTFGAGTVFGQCALLLSLPAKSEVHAATFCEIHTLGRRDLFYTLIDYPDAKEIVINVHKNLILNMLADKFRENKEKEAGNILTSSSFYKPPSEASKIARDDVCLVTTFPYIFMPDTLFMRAWNILQVIIISMVTFYYPYCAAYERRYPFEIESLIVMVDIIYVLDIYLTFFTAVNKENILLSTGRQIARERLRHPNIYLDTVSTLPLHYLLPHDSRHKPVILCLRIIKMYKIPLLFGQAEYNLYWTVISLLRIVKYVIYFLVGCYAVGVLYYMQACYSETCNPSSWYAKRILARMHGPVFMSLYFAVMVISGTGLGDFTVGNTKDIVWVLNFYFPAVLLLCYIISEYSAHLSLAREQRFNFTELSERVNSFLTSNKMLPSERMRVRQYLNLQWEKNMGYEFTYGHELFYDTPAHLYSEINLQSRCKGIQDMVLFKGLGENIISTILKSSFRRTLPPHEVVIYAGEMCSTLLIVEEGYCEVTYGRDVSIKRIIGPGANISTVELFLGLTAMCHVRTLTHCVIVKVKKSDIRRALILNPVAARELELAIHEFKEFPIAHVFRKARPIRLHLSVRSSVQHSLFRFRYYQKQSGNKELREPYLKLGICQCIRFVLRSTTVLPYGKLLKKWEVSRCIFAFFSAVLFPPLPYLQLEHTFLYWIGWFLDVTA
ncbi:UNVERIFIED_CONTAM: hypothetical protein PYX00_001599 [Menopon gallinae]|uniref:Cyclic nucleotide-binding domain-containing protein n=1 Tax=Menopon gallinae TaxID=328185 RepID=A0AAW2IES4_9NEOP